MFIIITLHSPKNIKICLILSILLLILINSLHLHNLCTKDSNIRELKVAKILRSLKLGARSEKMQTADKTIFWTNVCSVFKVLCREFLSISILKSELPRDGASWKINELILQS